MGWGRGGERESGWGVEGRGRSQRDLQISLGKKQTNAHGDCLAFLTFQSAVRARLRKPDILAAGNMYQRSQTSKGEPQSSGVKAPVVTCIFALLEFSFCG